jgi:uncharacterized protein
MASPTIPVGWSDATPWAMTVACSHNNSDPLVTLCARVCRRGLDRNSVQRVRALSRARPRRPTDDLGVRIPQSRSVRVQPRSPRAGTWPAAQLMIVATSTQDMFLLAASTVYRRQPLSPEGGEIVGIITEDMRRIVDGAKLAFVATVCEDGSPNLSPKGSLLVYDDDQLIFMNMASPTTVQNLRRDPRLEVNVVDFLLRRGYRFKGTGELRGPGDPAYVWMREWVMETHGPDYPVHEAVLIHVERALPVESPAYTFGHWSEDKLKRAWAHKYGLEFQADAKPASTARS